jgi:hypothetical protein
VEGTDPCGGVGSRRSRVLTLIDRFTPASAWLAPATR